MQSRLQCHAAHPCRCLFHTPHPPFCVALVAPHTLHFLAPRHPHLSSLPTQPTTHPLKVQLRFPALRNSAQRSVALTSPFPAAPAPPAALAAVRGVYPYQPFVPSPLPNPRPMFPSSLATSHLPPPRCTHTRTAFCSRPTQTQNHSTRPYGDTAVRSSLRVPPLPPPHFSNFFLPHAAPAPDTVSCIPPWYLPVHTCMAPDVFIFFHRRLETAAAPRGVRMTTFHPFCPCNA